MYKIFIAAFCVALLAQPVGAHAAAPDNAREDQVPVVFDALFMRLPGAVATAGGFVVWTAGVFVPPFLLAWRPTEMDQTFKALVVNPFRFTFVDPLGYHPNRVESNRAGEIE
jgi:uncharacterized membrane protein